MKNCRKNNQIAKIRDKTIDYLNIYNFNLIHTTRFTLYISVGDQNNIIIIMIHDTGKYLKLQNIQF